MQRYSFWDVFDRTPTGGLTPKIRISVNGISFGHGVTFGPGVSFGGIDFTKYIGKDIAAEDQNGILVIKGIYK